jgi:hypothetical protein
MATPRVGILPSSERQAIFEGAKRLGLDPYEFGAFLSLESGPNMDPNIVGGAGKRHKGLIQFGLPEQKQYGISGPQTRAGQMPAVLQYFEDRGFKPGMDIGRAYATVLGGNPNVSLNAKDSFGTSVSGALPRFRKGGDLYANAQRVLGDPLVVNGQPSTAAPQSASASTPQLAGTSAAYGPTLEESMGIKLMQQAMQGVSQPKNPAQRFIDFMSGVGNNLGVITNPLSTPGY